MRSHTDKREKRTRFLFSHIGKSKDEGFFPLIFSSAKTEAGLGTQALPENLSRTSGCRGFTGPVPPPLLMSFGY